MALLLTVAARASLAQDRPSSARPASAILEGSQYAVRPDRGQITLRFNKAVRYRSGRLKNPERVYVDLLGVSAGPTWAPPPISANDAFIKQIRTGVPAPNTTRITVDLKVPAEVSFLALKDPPRLVLILRGAGPASSREPTRLPPLISRVPSPATPIVDFPPPEAALSPPTPALPIASSPVVPGSPPLISPDPGGQPSHAPAPLLQTGKLRIPRVSRAPKLEDFLLGTPREDEALITDFRQRDPGDGAPVSQQTSAYLSYDNENLYVIFVCSDLPGKVRAHMAKREDIPDDDVVGIYLDSFRDRQHAYYFAANPLGIQLDGLIADSDSSPDTSFDTLWHSEGQITPEGFVVWMSIPFKSLRFSHQADQTWGIALRRSILRSGETAFWPYITNRTASFLDQLASLEGLNAVSSSRNVQLIPYVTGADGRLANPGATGYQTQSEIRGGVDGKVVLHDALTLDFTVNPDFSQVESDDPQVTVNKRYEVFFPEKRPFFIEDAGYFSTPINLFFSRQIVDPQFGTRLTGRVGRWSIGALVIDDRAPGEVLRPSDSLFGDHAIIGAARIQRDFAKQSQFGVMVTSRVFGSNSNTVASFDTRLKLSPNWFFTGQIVRTFDRQANTGQKSDLQGRGYSAALSRNDRHWTYQASYLDLSPDFNSELGFIPRVDMRQGKNYLGYFWRPEGKAILDYGLSGTVTAVWNHLGQTQDVNSYIQFQMDFTGRTGFAVSRFDAYELYLNQGFRYATSGGSFYANWLKWLYLSGGYTVGNGVNYYPAAGVAPFLGNSQNASFGVKLRPKPRIQIEQSYYYSRLGSHPGFEFAGGRPTVFDDYLSRTKLNYQFTRALSLRGIMDYDALISNASLFGQQTTKQLTGDVLLTYLLNPGTALYLGYDNRYENLAANPAMPPALVRFGTPTYLTGRQIFVKLTYRLRF